MKVPVPLSKCPDCKTSPLFTAKSPLSLPPPPKSRTGTELSSVTSCTSSVAAGIELLMPTRPVLKTEISLWPLVLLRIKKLAVWFLIW